MTDVDDRAHIAVHADPCTSSTKLFQSQRVDRNRFSSSRRIARAESSLATLCPATSTVKFFNRLVGFSFRALSNFRASQRGSSSFLQYSATSEINEACWMAAAKFTYRLGVSPASFHAFFARSVRVTQSQGEACRFLCDGVELTGKGCLCGLSSDACFPTHEMKSRIAILRLVRTRTPRAPNQVLKFFRARRWRARCPPAV